MKKAMKKVRRTKKRAKVVTFNVNKKECGLALQGLTSAFVWSESPEGHEYWSGTAARLGELST